MKKIFESSYVKQDKNAKTLSFFCTKDLVMINRDIISQLVEKTKNNGNCDIRISLHKSPLEDFHNMIILQNKNNYYRPHRHQRKVESYQMIKGKMGIFIFNDDGELLESNVLSTGKNFIYRISANAWHVSIPLTEFVIFHESKLGPFLGKDDSIFPKWAPDGSDPYTAKNFFASLLKRLKNDMEVIKNA